MSKLEEEFARDSRRRARWDAVHAVFLTVVGLLIIGAAIAFECYREGKIWGWW